MSTRPIDLIFRDPEVVSDAFFVTLCRGGMTLAWQRLAEALNCTMKWGSSIPHFACGFTNSSVERARKAWFIHDPDGNICSATAGNPGNSVSMDWQHAAPGSVDYWDEVIGGWLAAHLSPAAAVFLDVVDGLGCQANVTTHSWDQTNCSAAQGGKGVDPAQLTPSMLLADSRGCLDAIRRIGRRLLKADKALIINSGRVQPNANGSPGRAGEHCLLPWSEFLAGVKTVPNLIWFREAWNASLELPTALTLLREGVPKLIHYFGSADPNSTDPSVEGAMASFLVVQGAYDYFAISSKWTDAGGMNWHNQFDQYDCGEPLAPLPTVRGMVWTREFANCTVRYDRSLAQCGMVGNVGCGTITLKKDLARLSPKSRDYPTIFDVTTFGTAGDGVTDDWAPIQRAFEAARKFGATATQRAHIVVPPGTYLVQSGLQLRANHITLIIDGRLVLPASPEDWPMQSDLVGEHGNNTALLRVAGTTGVVVTGRGSLYGNGEHYWVGPTRPSCEWWHTTALPTSCAPALLIVNASSNFTLDGLSLEHPPGGHIALHGVQNATLRSFVIQSPKIAPDTDGIDTTHVNGLHIYNATINSGDDNVAMKNDTQNVVIEDCVFGHGHGASIGSIPMDGFRGWLGLVRNITMRRVLLNGTDFGVRVKTWQNATGSIRDVAYEDLTLIGVGTAIEVNAFYCQPSYCPGALKPAIDSCCGARAMENVTQNVLISGLRIERVSGSAVAKAGSLRCSAGKFGCEGIVMRGVSISAPQGFDCSNASGVAQEVSPAACLQP